MIRLIATILLLAAALPPEEPPADPNAAAAPRRPLDFRLFRDLDRPVTGSWTLEVPRLPARAIEIRLSEGKADALVGVDRADGREVLRVERKKEGIGFQGTLADLLTTCGLGPLPITEFLPLGDAIVLSFSASPTEIPCPPIDGGDAGRFVVVSPRGPVRLRDLSEISGPSAGGGAPLRDEEREAISYAIPLGAVSVEPGTTVRFLRRLRAAIDGGFWFEIEVALSSQEGVAPPRGFVRGEALLFQGSLTLKRAG